MCLSQMHAGARQCIVNTFFSVYILSGAYLLQPLFFSSSKFIFILFFLPPFRLSHLSTQYLQGSWPVLIIKSTQDFHTTTQLGISKASITLGENKTKQNSSSSVFLEASPCSHRHDHSFWNFCPSFRKYHCREAEQGRMLLGVEHVSFRRRLAGYSSTLLASSYQDRCSILNLTLRKPMEFYLEKTCAFSLALL